MAFFPDVQRGEKVQHLMLLENNVRHLINSLNGFGSGMGRGAGSGVVRIQIWNASGGALAAGQPVAFDGTKAMCGDAVPAVSVTDSQKPWGVCVQKLAAKALGDCIIAGPAVVSLSGSSGDYAEPVVNGTGFTRSETGTARVLFAGSKSIILLGSSGGADTYFGPHAIAYNKTTGKVEITAGYVLQNGLFAQTSDTSLTPQTGIICVKNTLYVSGWGTPAIAFATPSELAYPIGACTVTGSGSNMTVKLECYHQPVAFLFVVGDCVE